MTPQTEIEIDMRFARKYTVGDKTVIETEDVRVTLIPEPAPIFDAVGIQGTLF